MSDPVPHRAEPFRDELIPALSPMPSFGYETGVKQEAEMLGNSRTADLKVPRDRVD